MKIRLNPFTGRFEIKDEFEVESVPGVAEAVWVAVDKTCEPGALVGDFVYHSPTTDDLVIVNTDNVIDYPTIGMIIRKYSATTCRIGLFGEFILSDIIDRGEQVYLSLTGRATTSNPSTGYLQVLGYATSTNKMIFNPDITRIKRAL